MDAQPDRRVAGRSELSIGARFTAFRITTSTTTRHHAAMSVARSSDPASRWGPRRGDGDILGHELMLHASRFTIVDKGLIPVGITASVVDTPLDFLAPKNIGARIRQLGHGYDHNFALAGPLNVVKPCATVHEPTSGRIMEIATTEPGVQLYTGNYLDGSVLGKGGKPYGQHAGFCLETQHYPDSPNKPNFPSTVLEPGKKFTSLTVHKFSAK